MFLRSNKKTTQIEEQGYDHNENIKDTKMSLVSIVQSLFDNINYYTEELIKLEKENKQLKQFINELSDLIHADREYMLPEMKAFLLKNSSPTNEEENLTKD
jgi:cell shape-determining protein MreC